MNLARRHRAVTIDDVAKKAGVSVKTVSRVLNNEPNVRVSKREQVMKAAQALGYHPNPAARSLAGARSFLIAHLYNNPAPEYIAAVNAGIYDACRCNGYFLLPECVEHETPDFLDRLGSFFKASRVDGVVLTPPICDDERVLDFLQENETAYASLSPARQPKAAPFMCLDNRLAATEIVRHLVSLGHKRIGFIKGPDGHTDARERYEGYRDAMAESKLDIEPHMIGQGDYSLRTGFEAASNMAGDGTTRVSAIFAANDDMAVGAMTALMTSGFRVPEDISVAGYDDTRLASAIWPSLTTVRQPIRDMARRAAERLMTQGGPDDPLEEAFGFELVVRQSTGIVGSL